MRFNYEAVKAAGSMGMRRLKAMRACGYSAEDRVAIALQRKRLAMVLVVFLGLQILQKQMPMMVQKFAAALTGLCFFAILALSWAVVLRGSDEYRKALLQRSMMLGLGITLGAVCVCGYLETATNGGFRVPLLAVPAGFVFITAVAKVAVFRKELRPAGGLEGV